MSIKVHNVQLKATITFSSDIKIISSLRFRDQSADRSKLLFESPSAKLRSNEDLEVSYFSNYC